MSAAHHVSKLRGIANAGNNVFNDQIVAQGIKMIIATAKTRTNKIFIIV
jgi:protein involved in ribonucleotide reduction